MVRPLAYLNKNGATICMQILINEHLVDQLLLPESSIIWYGYNFFYLALICGDYSFAKIRDGDG